MGADRATPVEGTTPGSSQHRMLLQDLTELDEADAQAQLLAAASRLRTRNPKVDTLVLECTKMPPMPMRCATRRASRCWT